MPARVKRSRPTSLRATQRICSLSRAASRAKSPPRSRRAFRRRRFRRDRRPAHVAQGTANRDAYDLYWRGRFLLFARRTLPLAVDLFQQAIDKDSSFARAYAALGETLEYLPYFNGVPADSVRTRAMRAAQRALAIDSTLAQAHVALGLAHMHAFEWKEASDELRRAIAADSNDVSALTQYARYLLYIGRPADALAIITRAPRSSHSRRSSPRGKSVLSRCSGVTTRRSPSRAVASRSTRCHRR